MIRFLLRDEFDAREGTDRTGRGTRAGEAAKSSEEETRRRRRRRRRRRQRRGRRRRRRSRRRGPDVSSSVSSAPSSARSPHPSSALDVSALRSRGTEPHRAPKKDARDNLGRTPLYVAAAAGATRALLALCDVGADLNAAPERPETRRQRDEHDRDGFDGVSSVDAPVAAAARRGDMREVQELVRRGADPGPRARSALRSCALRRRFTRTRRSRGTRGAYLGSRFIAATPPSARRWVRTARSACTARRRRAWGTSA